jgi:hypothetical protein
MEFAPALLPDAVASPEVTLEWTLPEALILMGVA